MCAPSELLITQRASRKRHASSAEQTESARSRAPSRPRHCSDRAAPRRVERRRLDRNQGLSSTPLSCRYPLAVAMAVALSTQHSAHSTLGTRGTARARREGGGNVSVTRRARAARAPERRASRRQPPRGHSDSSAPHQGRLEQSVKPKPTRENSA